MTQKTQLNQDEKNAEQLLEEIKSMHEEIRDLGKRLDKIMLQTKQDMKESGDQ